MSKKLIDTTQFHMNIKVAKKASGLTNDDVSEALGLRIRGYDTKMTRLLNKGSETAFTASDLAILAKIFDCSVDSLLVGVYYV